MNRITTQLILMAMIALLAAPVLADDDDDGGLFGWFGEERELEDAIKPVKNELYKSECGGCHMAYPPGLLPASSWERIMGNLSDHFGDNAELLPGDNAPIRQYLMDNAGGGRASVMSAGPGGTKDAPLRITETRIFLSEHDEIPGQVVQQNKEVRSFANCQACHTKADQGRFAEREINIPGLGRWDD